MQIVNGQPTFGSTDVTYRNDGRFAYDDQNNVMGLWGGNMGANAGQALDTSQTSFLDYLKQNNGQGILAGLGTQMGPTTWDQTLTGANADMWGNSRGNPYYEFMLQQRTGGNISRPNPYLSRFSMGGTTDNYQSSEQDPRTLSGLTPLYDGVMAPRAVPTLSPDFSPVGFQDPFNTDWQY